MEVDFGGEEGPKAEDQLRGGSLETGEPPPAADGGQAEEFDVSQIDFGEEDFQEIFGAGAPEQENVQDQQIPLQSQQEEQHSGADQALGVDFSGLNGTDDAGEGNVLGKEEGEDAEEDDKIGGISGGSEDDDVSLASDDDAKQEEVKKQNGGGGGGDEDGDDEDDDGDERDAKGKKKKSRQLGKERRKIRKIIDENDLNEDTRAAQEKEKERREWEQKLAGAASGAMADKAIINPLADQESQIRIHPQLAQRLKDHQTDGVRFLWQRLMDGRSSKNARGGLGSLWALAEGDRGAGCVLAHNMGLGKTFQVITFLHTVAANIPHDHMELRRMLVLGPLNTLHNWKAELARFLPDEGRLPNGKTIQVFILDEAGKTNKHRCDYLERWFREGGVMCVGYEMYRNLAGSQRIKDKKLQDRLDRYLRDPGPGLVIADEGHVLRNHKSGISRALARVVSRRRAVLTGSPLQNNLSEYHCMIDFINPGFLGTQAEFRNRFETPIMNGEAVDAEARDVLLMKRRNFILNQQLQPMVQRKDFTPLVKALPPKFEFTLQIRLSDLQKRLYAFASEHRGLSGITGVFTAFHTMLKIWDHPCVLHLSAKRDPKDGHDDEHVGGAGAGGAGGAGGGASPLIRQVSHEPEVELIDSDSDDCVAVGPRGPKMPNGGAGAFGAHGHGHGGQGGGGGGGADWFWRVYEQVGVSDQDVMSIEHSGKCLVLWKLLTEATKQDEKVLVFSQSLLMLDALETMLDRHPICGERWQINVDYYRLDGSRSSRSRQSDIDSFNDIANTKARLFLISTRAGSLGVNMVAANRVVLFDCSFNPSYDLQAIFRTYRYGQTRPVFVYRLVAWGTMEEKIYKRQIRKHSRSARAVDSKQIERHFTESELQLTDLSSVLQMEDEVNLDSDSDDEGVGVVGVEDVRAAMAKDPILRSMIDKQKMKGDRNDKLRRSLVRTVTLDESLIRDKEDEQLTEQEQKEAIQDFEFEKQNFPGGRPVVKPPTAPMPLPPHLAQEERIVKCQCGVSLKVKVHVKSHCPRCKFVFNRLPPVGGGGGWSESLLRTVNSPGGPHGGGVRSGGAGAQDDMTQQLSFLVTQRQQQQQQHQMMVNRPLGLPLPQQSFGAHMPPSHQQQQQQQQRQPQLLHQQGLPGRDQSWGGYVDDARRRGGPDTANAPFGGTYPPHFQQPGQMQGGGAGYGGAGGGVNDEQVVDLDGGDEEEASAEQTMEVTCGMEGCQGTTKVRVWQTEFDCSVCGSRCRLLECPDPSCNQLQSIPMGASSFTCSVCRRFCSLLGGNASQPPQHSQAPADDDPRSGPAAPGGSMDEQPAHEAGGGRAGEGNEGGGQPGPAESGQGAVSDQNQFEGAWEQAPVREGWGEDDGGGGAGERSAESGGGREGEEYGALFGDFPVGEEGGFDVDDEAALL